jgi:hypothetical protein
MDTLPERRRAIVLYPYTMRYWICYHPLNNVNTDFECNGNDDPNGGFEPLPAEELR